jgi:hypothetical protein
VKRLVLALLLSVLLLARAEAQAVQPDLSFRFGINLLVLPGFSLGFEAREPRGGIGVRASFEYLLVLYGYSIDVYVFVPISSTWDVYFGAGRLRIVDGLALSVPFELTYGLLGVRLRNGFFLEVMPGVGNTEGCRQTVTPPFQPCTTSAGVFAILGKLGFAWRL